MGHHHSASKRTPLLEQPVLNLLPPKQKMFCVRDTDSIATMLQQCAEKKISSTPVYSVDYQTVLGIIDMSDVAAYLVSAYLNGGPSVIKDGNTVLQAPVSAAMEKSKRNRFLLLPNDTTVYEATKKMCDLMIYRAAIMNEEKQIAAIVTQSMILGFLQKHFDDLYPNGGKTMADLKGIGTMHVHCVHEDMLTIDAFHEMTSKSVSCVGVISQSKNLMCCLSASHLKGITANDVELLLKPVKEFVSARQIALIKINEIQPQLLSGTDDMTLKLLVDALVAHKFHHYFLIDPETRRPSRIISLGDILREFLYSGEQLQSRSTLNRTKFTV
jgi:predicted transcriptional regulator